MGQKITHHFFRVVRFLKLTLQLVYVDNFGKFSLRAQKQQNKTFSQLNLIPSSIKHGI